MVVFKNNNCFSLVTFVIKLCQNLELLAQKMVGLKCRFKVKCYLILCFPMCTFHCIALKSSYILRRVLLTLGPWR